MENLAKAEAERHARAANERLHAIRDAERYAENKHLLGKAFKTKNNYSCPEKRSDYWWQYAKVRDVDVNGYLSVFLFQTDKYGTVTIMQAEHRFRMDDYIPCGKAEFDKARRRLQQAVFKTKP